MRTLGKVGKQKKNKNRLRRVSKTTSKSSGLLHDSIVGTLNAFATTSPISALTNPSPTLKLQSRGKLSMTGGTNVASLLIIQPNVFDSYLSLTGTLTGAIGDGTPGNAFTGQFRGYPDAIFYNISSSALNLGNTTATPSVLYAPGYSGLTAARDSEQESRIVSVGIRLQNRTVEQYRMPIAYIYHDFHGQLQSKIVGDNSITHADLESFIVSSPYTVTWDCTKEPIFEYTITSDDQDGQFLRNGNQVLDPENAPAFLTSHNVANSGLPNSGFLVAPVGNWGLVNNNVYTVGGPLIANPVVYVLFPGPASTSFINQYELTMVNNYEIKNHTLEASGMLTPSLAAKGVAEVVNSVKHHKHRHMGRSLVTASKTLCQKAFKEASKHIVDSASKAAVAAAIAML